MELVFDFGNAWGKWYAPKTKVKGDFTHAIALLTENNWRTIVGRGKPPKGIFKVNGTPYAIGQAARRHTIQDRPKGAARYNEMYYGTALAYALCDAFEQDDPNVSLVASHPPIDQKYAQNIAIAAKRHWTVECDKGVLEFDVKRFLPFDEPLGGYSHYVFNEDGTERKKNPLQDKTTLVVDAGGYTVDVVPVDPDGQIDYLGADSTRTGTIDLTKGFESELRSNNPSMFQDAGDLDPRRLEQAIRSGIYHFGNIQIDCCAEASAAIMSLVNDVIQVINTAGGAANYDVILVTGGGSALIYDTLCAAMPRIDFLLAEPVRENMKFANVFGGAKISAMIKRMRVK